MIRLIPSQNRSLYLLVAFLVLATAIFVVVIFLSLFSQPRDTNQPGQTIPTSGPNPSPSLPPGAEYDIQQNPEYIKSVRQIEEDRKQITDQDNIVGQLLHKMPYVGKNFSMNFSYKNNQFTVIIPTAKRTEGEKEFNDFLIQNQIQSPSWINGLVVQYQ